MIPFNTYGTVITSEVLCYLLQREMKIKTWSLASRHLQTGRKNTTRITNV